MVSSVCTRTITINRSGVARFLVEMEGTSILNEMRAKFQVCISLDKVHWAPLQCQVMITWDTIPLPLFHMLVYIRNMKLYTMTLLYHA